MKQKTIVVLITVLLLLAVPVQLLCWGFLLPECYDTSFLGELKYKVRLLEQTPGKRIVLVGGSSVAFGVDSGLLEDAFPEYRVVNFGMYAALGTTVMLDLSQNRIREGDIVILIPEQQEQALSEFFDPAVMWQGVDGAFGLLSSLPTEKLGRMAGSFPAFAGQKCAYFLSGAAPQPEGVYCRDAFNEFGDVVSPLCARNVMPGGYDANTPVRFETDMVSDGFAERVNEYSAALEEKGAAVWYGFCPMNEAAVEAGADVDGFCDALSRQLSCPLVGNPHDSILLSGWFFDTNFHLNASGKILYTRNLIGAIKAMLADSSPTEIGVPAMPEPEKAGLPAGNNEDAACFTYEIGADSVTVTGPTAEGLTRQSLTVPTTYQNLPVTAIAPGAFAGAEKLEEITLQTGIRAIGDGAFRGCGSLMRIILESVVPSECRVGQKLLEGTEANVYVPAETLSAYRTDYFWSIFGSRVRPAV